MDDQSPKPCLQAGTASALNSTQGKGSRDKNELSQERENQGENSKRAGAHGNRGMLRKQQEQGAKLSCPSCRAKGMSKERSKKTRSQLPPALLQLPLSTSGWAAAFSPPFLN